MEGKAKLFPQCLLKVYTYADTDEATASVSQLQRFTDDGITVTRSVMSFTFPISIVIVTSHR